MTYYHLIFQQFQLNPAYYRDQRQPSHSSQCLFSSIAFVWVKWGLSFKSSSYLEEDRIDHFSRWSSSWLKDGSNYGSLAKYGRGMIFILPADSWTYLGFYCFYCQNNINKIWFLSALPNMKNSTAALSLGSLGMTCQLLIGFNCQRN